jgi:hypothetical protein
MFRVIVLFATLALAVAFAPQRVSRAQVTMAAESYQAKIGKAIGVAGMAFALAGPAMPMPALADGAVSRSTVYRARNNYGRRILDLKDAAKAGDFAAFEERKSVNAFDLFISGSNALNGKIDKERKAAETALEKQLFSAVKAKDAGKLKSVFDEFVKVAELETGFKNNELGQTDSSGYSPTWGTSKQYIYQR